MHTDYSYVELLLIIPWSVGALVLPGIGMVVFVDKGDGKVGHRSEGWCAWSLKCGQSPAK